MSSYLPAGSDVAHERVEDEVIVINLATGAYFSLRDAAADYWTLLAAGTEVAHIGATMSARYGANRTDVDADLAALAARLVQEGLLKKAESPATAPELPAPAAPLKYGTPKLDKYDDMEELLLLDPIHEVDAAGWPLVPTEPA